MSIYRVYLHTVPVATADSKAKKPRTIPYTYPTIREEADGSKPNPHEKQSFHFEGSLSDCLASAKTYGIDTLNQAGKSTLTACYDQDYLLLRGSNDVSILELDPQRWSEGGGTRDGSGLKVSRLVDKLWADSARGAGKFSETAKSIPAELLDRVIGKLQAEGDGGQKLVRAVEKARQ